MLIIAGSLLILSILVNNLIKQYIETKSFAVNAEETDTEF